MYRIIILIAFACIFSPRLQGQFDVAPKGPFTRLQIAFGVTFNIQINDPNVTVDYYKWDLFVQDGDTTRSLRSMQGSDSTRFTVSLADVPAIPQPQLAVTLTLRNSFSPTPYNVTRVFPVQYQDPIYRIVEGDGKGGLFDTLRRHVVGRPVATGYAITWFPNNTTYAALMLLHPNGDTLAIEKKTGPLRFDDALVLDVTIDEWPGAMRLRSHVIYDGCPEGGYISDAVVPDSTPVPNIKASSGFGPFRRGVDQPNRITVYGLGPKCTAIERTISYATDDGQIHVPLRDTIMYNGQNDSVSFDVNMRDISQGSVLRVRGLFGSYLPVSGTTKEFVILNPPPVYSITGGLPIVPGVGRPVTVRLDSLPARVVQLQMILTSAAGSVLQQKTINAKQGEYLRAGEISFDGRELSLGTYVVRTRVVNDMREYAPNFFFGIDVRDTSKYFLIADSWGPHTRGDSSMFTPAVTDVRAKPLPGWKITGRFILIDSTKPNIPLLISPEIDLTNVKSRDSIVYWPDSSYVFGGPITSRQRIQTVDLPLSAKVLLEVASLSPTDQRTLDYTISHPVIVVPSPGTLTSIPGMDSTFIVTRNSPLSLRFSNIAPEATAVRMAISGMRNKTPLVERIISVNPNQNSVSLTIDAGELPINSEVTVSTITSLADDKGAELTRSINTRPDGLSMRAEPPIDTLLMEWDIDGKTQLIRGPQTLNSRLIFSKLPAQTLEIHVLSYDDLGTVIDSITYPVPYRLRYDSTLTVEGMFPFRTFNVSSIQVRYFTDGGPEGGVRYNKPIVTLFREPLAARVQKMSFSTTPPSVDRSPILQGSHDLVELALRWRSFEPRSNVGYSNPLTIDSVRLQILDCAGNVLDNMLVRPTNASINGGSAADTLYAVAKLPLSTSSILCRMYSKSMTLPSDGVVATAPFQLKTNPVPHIPLGYSYPTSRINDTATKQLTQRMTITNLNSVVTIDSLRIVDKDGKILTLLSAQRVNQDTIAIAAYNFNELDPDGSPYTLRGVVKTSTCAITALQDLPLAQVYASRLLPGSALYNWVYSSKGWGPFQQGRAPTTQIITGLSPHSFRPNLRGQIADSMEVGITVYSGFLKKEITREIITGYVFPADKPIPELATCIAPVELTALDTNSYVRIHVRYLWKQMNGVEEKYNNTFDFPVAMLPFPDQPIDPDTTRYEQSVLAGTPNVSVMQSNYNFGMRAQSTDIDRLWFTMVSSGGVTLDTFTIQPASRNTLDTTSLFKKLRDVAQYPWPHVARERERVDILIGYQFKGATVPTKTQKTSIRILPRAEWLNGSTATLNGSATQTSIPISVSIPMPASTYSSVVPVFGLINYWIQGDGGDESTNLNIKANYNPATRGFTLTNSAPGGSFWVPTISIGGGSNYNKSSISRDGQKSGEFTALYRFEEAPLTTGGDTVADRELRVRSLYTSSYGGAVSMVRWIIETKETIEGLIKTAALIASGGLLEITPTFTIDASVQQLSTVNIGTEERGALLHLGEEEPTKSTEQDEFPTSQSVAFTLTGGGGIEASMLGLIGIGASVSDDYMFASGSLYHGSVAERESKYYPTRLNYSRWFNLELSLFFGIINIDLFRGRMLHLYDPRLVPSYIVFDEAWESVFTSSVPGKQSEGVQLLRQIAKLPAETPYYRPSPKLAANDSVMVSVHLEQSLLGRNGRLVLSTLDRSTHSLVNTAVVADNRNAIHDPALALVGNDGSAAIAWVQNDVDAYSTPASTEIDELLVSENIHVAIYNASTQSIVKLSDVTRKSDQMIDCLPAVAFTSDAKRGIVAWSAITPDSGSVEVYTREIVFSTDSGWQMKEPTLLKQMAGMDRDVSVASLNDGSFIVTWINQDVVSSKITINSATISVDGSIRTQEVASIANANLSQIDMASNSTQAFLVFARSVSAGKNEFERSADAYIYADGSWELLGSLDLGTGYGVCRHIDASINDDGAFLTVVDAVNFSREKSAQHVMYTLVGNVDDEADEWHLFGNHPTHAVPARSVWSLSTQIGPNNTLYIATQELDTLRDNRQTYENGVQMGPSRCNSVVRAVRLDEKDNLVSVPFGNGTTSVSGEGNSDLEAVLRYRVKVMDPAPNPVREACVIPLAVQRGCDVEMKLYDAVGSYVATIYSGPVSEGIQGISCDVSSLATGHYTVVVSDQLGMAGSVPVVVVR